MAKDTRQLSVFHVADGVGRMIDSTAWCDGYGMFGRSLPNRTFSPSESTSVNPSHGKGWAYSVNSVNTMVVHRISALEVILKEGPSEPDFTIARKPVPKLMTTPGATLREVTNG
jgi:hypothetical protein